MKLIGDVLFLGVSDPSLLQWRLEDVYLLIFWKNQESLLKKFFFIAFLIVKGLALYKAPTEIWPSPF